MAVVAERDQRVARVIDREVAPIWHDRFARMIFQKLPAWSESMVLDVHCGPGRTTGELLQRLDDSSRVFALDPDPAFIALAKSRVRTEWKKRVYFKQGDLSAVTGMGDDSYDVAMANLVLGQAHDPRGVLAELIRVTKPGGRVLATMAMRGTWTEVEDLLGEVLSDAGIADRTLPRLERVQKLRPTGSGLAQIATDLGLDQDSFLIEQRKFSLLFPSGREFLFSPVVEYGPLRMWKAIIGDDGKPSELFWRLKESIDAYFAEHVFSVTAIAGLLTIEVPTGTQSSLPAFWNRYPELDRLWREGAVGQEPALEAGEGDEIDVDVDVDIDIDIEDAPDDDEAGSSAVRRTTGSSRTIPRPTPAGEFAAEDEDIFAALQQSDDEIDSLLDEVFEFGEGDSVAKRKRTLSTPSLSAARERKKLERAPQPPPLRPGESGKGLRPGDSGTGLRPEDSGSAPVPRGSKRPSLRLKPLPAPGEQTGPRKAGSKKPKDRG